MSWRSNRARRSLAARQVDTFAYGQTRDYADCLHDYANTVGKDRTRVETRRCGAIGAPVYLPYADPDLCLRLTRRHIPSHLSGKCLHSGT